MVRRGKEGPEFMERVVYRSLGSESPKTRVGPGIGLDNAVVSIGRGKVMILTVDPVSAIPAFGMKLSAWLSVHLIASDYTSSGGDPEFATFSYNFPEAMSQDDREEYVRSVGRECKKLGVSIVGGHTGSYPGGGSTVVGAGSMVGFAPEGGYVAPSMARIGDSILMTKHAALEATASLALSFPVFTDTSVGPEAAAKARSMLRLCSTVRDALAARKVGLGDGVSSMHDATEGGVLGALEEMATASKKSFVVDVDSIPVPPEVRGVCAAFGIDPLTTMGEGSLLITCSPARVGGLERSVRQAGIPIIEIGAVKRGGGLRLRRGDTTRKFLPGPDGYWTAYEEGVRRRLK